MATDSAAVELINTDKTEEEAKIQQNNVAIDIKEEEKEEKEEKAKQLPDTIAFVDFEKSLKHKKIEKDVQNILDENVGWRLRDEIYKQARKLHEKFPKIDDKEMMDICNIDFTDLANAYNKRSALDDDELKHLIRRNSDRKTIKKRYPLPVFSNKTWKINTKTDGYLFFELIFAFACLPIYLFAQTLFMFFYLVRGELPLSGCTDLVLKDHFNVDLQHDKEPKRKDSLDIITEDKLPTGYAVKNMCNRERPSHTACSDVLCCCCSGVKPRDYIYAVKRYKKRAKQQRQTLKGAQMQRITLRVQKKERAVHQDNIQEKLEEVDEERDKLLSQRAKSYCARTSCCCMCPTAWQMSPYLDVTKDGKSKAKRIYWTVGWFNNCTPYDMLSWCFSSEKDVESHRSELNLLGNRLNKQLVISLGDNPTLIMFFRLLICIIISVGYVLIWFNALSCAGYFYFGENILLYDFSDSKYGADCVFEGVFPLVIGALCAFIVSFWASFRAKIPVPNIKKLNRFKIHWYDFSNATEEEIMRQTVLFTSFMNNRTGNDTERAMLEQIESSTTTAMQFINLREAVFRKRVRERVHSHALLRFRHDNSYSLGVRVILSLIITFLPIIYRAISRDIDIFEFDMIFTITSMVLLFATSLFFFSFIKHQIFMTQQLDLFTFLLRDLTAIIKWPEGIDADDEEEDKDKDKDKSTARKYGFAVRKMDKFKMTTQTADKVDALSSDLDLSSLPYCNVLEHGNALSWVEMRSWIQGMIKSLLSKVDMLLIFIIILLFVITSGIIYLLAHHDEFGNQQIVINGIIFGAILLIYLGLFNLLPLLLHGPKLKKLQKQQLSSLEKKKLMATNIVNNKEYFRQFTFKDDSSLWQGKLKKFAPNLGLGFLQTTINVVSGGDFSAGVLGKASSGLLLKSTGVLAAAAFPTILESLFKK